MTFDRRGLLSAGMVTAGTGLGLGLLAAADQAAVAAPLTGGRSVLEFGAQAGTDAPQTAALQKAIEEIAKSGHPIFIPGGRYVTGALKLPANCAITGVPGATMLLAKDTDTVFDATDGVFSFSGLLVDGANGAPSKKGRALIAVTGGEVNVIRCSLKNAPAHALRLEKCAGALHGVEIEAAQGAGVWGDELAAFTVSQCRVNRSRAEGIRVASGRAPGGVVVAQNHVAGCQGAGIAVGGNAVVTGNFVSQARFGLKLGGGGDGHIMASGNLMRECSVGIGVASSGEMIFATLNLINAPRDGGVRAFDGDKLLGPDLTRQSAEAYLNLTVAGNVVR